MRLAAPSLLAFVTLALPRLALACPVCGQGREGSEGALLVMSGVLSALPLLMAGGIVAWIALRARAASADRTAAPIERTPDRRPEPTEAPDHAQA